MPQALYRKWRPQTFDDVVGQEPIVKTLRYALQTGRIHHAYLLAGPRGTGKTTTARLIAKAVNCLAPAAERPCSKCESCVAIGEGRLMDLIEIDAASNTGVDNIRDLLEKVGFRPTQATYKVYVIDEVHMLSTAAFNALLKTLEEPPEHVIFVLATTEPHKIPETILSRCQRFEFRRIPLDALIARLSVIAEAESVVTEPQALELIGRAATGSMRDAISLFDQMAANGTITADYVRTMLGAERREVVQRLLRAWVEEDLAEGLQIINGAIDGGADPRQLARQTADFLRGLLLMRLGAGQTWQDPTDAERESLSALARKTNPDRLVEAIRLFSQVASKQRTGWQPQLPLELAFVEACLAPEAPAVAITAPATTATRPAPAKAAPDSTPSRLNVRQRTRPAPTPVTKASPPKSEPAPAATRAEAKPSAAAPSTPAASLPDDRADPEFLVTIKAQWPSLLRAIRPVGLGALLRDAHVGGMDSQGRLVLAFQHDFHCAKVSETANIRRIEEAVAETFGQTITIHCLLGSAWQDPTPAANAGAKAAEIPVEEDELIRRAQEELGAVARLNN